MTNQQHPFGWGALPADFDLADLLALDEERNWQERALCAQADPEAWYPEVGGSTREAKRICLGCEVKDECLEYAMAHGERFGVWGGLSEPERRRLKNRGTLPTVSAKVAARQKRDEKIRKLRSQGMSIAEVAAAMGVGEWTVIRATASSDTERIAA